MESELLSLRSKIDELELKLGAHPSVISLTQSNPPTSRVQTNKSKKISDLDLSSQGQSRISQDKELIEALENKQPYYQT